MIKAKKITVVMINIFLLLYISKCNWIFNSSSSSSEGSIINSSLFSLYDQTAN
jgi:hypothetical protein